MGKATKSKFYAIRRGFKTGIFTMPWDETRKLVEGFKGAVFKGFKSLKEAEDYMKSMGNDRINKTSDSAGAETNPVVANVSQSGLVAPSQAAVPTILDNSSYSLVIPTAQETALMAVPEPLIVYTDGSCLGNGRSGAKAGYGVYFGRDDARNEWKRVTGPQTNNRGELMGVIRALELTNTVSKKVIIRSDSQYVRNGLESWMQKWKRNNWTRSTGELLNVDLWKRLDLLYTERARRGLLTIEYVKAHAGNAGNVAADKLANLGALMDL